MPAPVPLGPTTKLTVRAFDVAVFWFCVAAIVLLFAFAAGDA